LTESFQIVIQSIIAAEL